MAADGGPDGLAVRQGLRDDLAYLRAAHPRDGWQRHDNYGALADFWLGIHGQLRGEAWAATAAATALVERTVDPRAGLGALVPALNGLLGHLAQHHRIEDALYFPRFRRLDPRMAAAFDVLDADHNHIHEAVVSTADAANALLRAPADAAATEAMAGTLNRLVRLTARHLADEEEIVIPAMLTHGERALD